MDGCVPRPRRACRRSQLTGAGSKVWAWGSALVSLVGGSDHGSNPGATQRRSFLQALTVGSCLWRWWVPMLKVRGLERS
jgi:hypothetical protein